MLSALRQVLTISRWEVRRSATTMPREVLPVAVALFILLIVVTGYTQESGIHLQDRMYTAGVDSSDTGAIILGDPRFTVYLGTTGGTDLTIAPPDVRAADTDRGGAALKAFQTDYTRYRTVQYNREDDLFAAYPLWIDLQYVRSELDFTATEAGTGVSGAPNPFRNPVPDRPVRTVPEPSADIGYTREELRAELVGSEGEDRTVARYTDVVAGEGALGDFKTPSQLTPPLPFDAIVLVFVFIFPLYFTSQFYMMSVMNERIERRGEILLSSPLRPSAIIIGKMLPYLVVMIAVTAVLSLTTGETSVVLAAVFPVILFFLAAALLIGMAARSFKELSFISIFFSTIATSYLFFPSIFANIHVISLISPLTLIIYAIEGTPFTLADYFYSTFLFWVTAGILFAICIVNFNEERLFTLHPLRAKVREYIGSAISEKHPFASLFGITLFSIPFVLMAQLMLLVLLFNLPMPLSLLVLIFAAAFIEEWAKSVGIYAIAVERPAFLTWKNVILASLAVMAGFFLGEKLLLFATLAQISESVFGAALFTSLQVLWLPLSLHFTGAFITISLIKIFGKRSYPLALVVASLVHGAYNLFFIMGGF
ncbi:PrsW family intramembrane metalloprotease [Methanogenium sp. S4BF]|uniref:PrsW family intramembrane metalloprotease n=1 Tax=Methanogenium sp. S4BF TaxID=1789226 RepID=UPI00241632E0|nr:PrsW family intramembrane metalloprotease [Methanogenium sp. S4BF]WFN33771.1 PrsW family intramembrane metalloprotease [Methanogenium sp. S4BF]